MIDRPTWVVVELQDDGSWLMDLWPSEPPERDGRILVAAVPGMSVGGPPFSAIVALCGESFKKKTWRVRNGIDPDAEFTFLQVTGLTPHGMAVAKWGACRVHQDGVNREESNEG